MLQGAHGIGIANIAMDGTVLDTWYPSPQLGGENLTTATRRVSARELSDRFLNLIGMDRDRLVELVPVRTEIADLSAPPIDAHDVYLRLHLLSHRLVQPMQINMFDCLEHLAEVVWTNKGPCLADNFEYIRTNLRSRGQIQVLSIEQLPRMVDYVVPTGVAIAEAERVRLGAHLAPGTQVIREGYVSYNAGTIGPARVEGRLSSSVTVGEGSKVSLNALVAADEGVRRNRKPLNIGRNCRLRHSSGLIGVDLGDNCELGLGVVLEPSTTLFDARVGHQVHARDISGESSIVISNEPFSNSPVLRQRP